MQHISLYSQTNCHSTHYDHHSVSLSAGVIISIQSFTSKKAVFFIGALTTTFQLFTPSNSQSPKDDLQPQTPLYLPISLFKTMIHRTLLVTNPFPAHKSKTTIIAKPQFAGTYRQYPQSLFYSQLSCNKPGMSHDYRWISVLRWIIYVNTPPSKRHPRPSSSTVLNGVNAWGCKTGLRKLDTGVWCVVG